MYYHHVDSILYLHQERSGSFSISDLPTSPLSIIESTRNMNVRYGNFTRRRPSILSFRHFLHVLIILQFTSTFITRSEAFTQFSIGTNQSVLSSGTRDDSTTSSSRLALAAKKGISMAERRKRRQQKSQGTAGGRINPFADLPRSKLNDFRSTSTTTAPQEDDPIPAGPPSAAAEKAKELLTAQRASVNMLTHVKERAMERLSAVQVMDSLEEHGYAVIDDFLNDDSILSQLEQESHNMLLGDVSGGGVAVDVSNLGTGEYIAKIEGGSKQYVLCPRIVELVVSTTKNLPAAFENASASGCSLPSLDPSACMATLRIFDRKALKASLSLLTGQEDETVLDKDDDSDQSTQLATLVSDDSDQRKLSLYYYIVSGEWKEQYGGGLLFETGMVPAKRDRLVIFKSDATKFKPIPWKGSDIELSTTIASTIELHLVKMR